jgi:hypothetical protein
MFLHSWGKRFSCARPAALFDVLKHAFYAVDDSHALPRLLLGSLKLCELTNDKRTRYSMSSRTTVTGPSKPEGSRGEVAL